MQELEKTLNIIRKNLDNIYNSMGKAAEASGRALSDITLVAVTKTRSVAEIEALLNCGVHALGENRVQEWRDKSPELAQYADIFWNFIGQLQSNKIKYIIGKVSLIQSVDDYALAEAIHTMAEKRGCVQDVLLEVNAAQEPTKAGMDIAAVLEQAQRMQETLRSVNVRGIMTVAPNTGDEAMLRGIFQSMRAVFEDLRRQNGEKIEYLSMGMSNDYNFAIEEGSNMVRIGRGIFC